MSEYVNVDYLKNRITTNFDEQDLYLPTHFRDVIDDALDMTKEFDGEVKPVKHGEWLFKQRGKVVDMCCSECNYVLHPAIAYNLTAEQVEKSMENDTVWKTHYCPNCGADMRTLVHTAEEPTDDCVAIEFSADINEPNRWQSKDGEWHTGKIPTKAESEENKNVCIHD